MLKLLELDRRRDAYGWHDTELGHDFHDVETDLCERPRFAAGCKCLNLAFFVSISPGVPSGEA